MSESSDPSSSVDTADRKHLLYLIPETWPTFRADIKVLFGKYLPSFGVTCDLVTFHETQSGSPLSPLPAGSLIGGQAPRNRVAYHILKFALSVRTLVGLDRGSYDAIQVRNLPVHAAFAILIARWKGLPLFYWMSFPKHETQVAVARARGVKAGFKYWFPLVQGTIGRLLLFRWVLPYADHVFVQSRTMRDELVGSGIAKEKLTPVPMGVDMEAAESAPIQPVQDPRLRGKKVLVYLGTLDRVREIEHLFEMLKIVRACEPEAILVLVGQADDPEHCDWLRREAERVGVAESVIWTGWVPTEVAWSYVRAAKVGLSPFPRGKILDSASPTKAVEYLALGVPVVVNDNPDQEELVTERGGGICVQYLPEEFAAATLSLLRDDGIRMDMVKRGQAYVGMKRDYRHIAEALAMKYREML